MRSVRKTVVSSLTRLLLSVGERMTCLVLKRMLRSLTKMVLVVRERMTSLVGERMMRSPECLRSWLSWRQRSDGVMAQDVWIRYTLKIFL